MTIPGPREQEPQRENVSLRADLAERLGVICTHAAAIAPEKNLTVEGFIDDAVAAYLTGFDEFLKEDE